MLFGPSGQLMLGSMFAQLAVALGDADSITSSVQKTN